MTGTGADGPMLNKLTWGVVGFALGAYVMSRTDRRTRRKWMRQARRVGEALQSLDPR